MDIPTSRATLLVVDDIPENIDALVGLLRSEYKVKAAANGRRALEVAFSAPPDLILLDIMMPEMDGYEVCRRLHGDERTTGIPVIFVTAMDEAKDEEKGLALGAVDYITKPFSPAIVKARVKTHLALKAARDHLQELVDAKTEELRKAYVRMQRHVKELEARDRLVRFQLKGASLAESYQEIMQVFVQVLEVDQVAIYRLNASGQGLQFVDRLGPQARETGMSLADPLATSAFSTRKVQHDKEGGAAVPMIYQDEVMGVIRVNGLPTVSEYLEEAMNVLWRMGLEAALVMRMALVTDDLLDGTLDLDELLDMSE